MGRSVRSWHLHDWATCARSSPVDVAVQSALAICKSTYGVVETSLLLFQLLIRCSLGHDIAQKLEILDTRHSVGCEKLSEVRLKNKEQSYLTYQHLDTVCCAWVCAQSSRYCKIARQGAAKTFLQRR